MCEPVACHGVDANHRGGDRSARSAFRGAKPRLPGTGCHNESVAMSPSSCYEYPARVLRLRTSISYLEGQKGYVVVQSGNDNTNHSRQHGHCTIGHGPNKIHRQSAVQRTPPFVRNDMLRRANDTALGRLHRGVATVQPAHRERSPLGL